MFRYQPLQVKKAILRTRSRGVKTKKKNSISCSYYLYFANCTEERMKKQFSPRIFLVIIPAKRATTVAKNKHTISKTVS